MNPTHALAARRAVSPIFGQLYTACAVLGFISIFIPLYAPDPERVNRVGGKVTVATDYSLWRGITVYGEGVAVAGSAVIVVMVAVALLAAHAGHSFVPCACVLVLGIGGLLFLIASPGQPSSTVVGPGMGVLWGTVLVLLVTSAVHLFRTTGARR